MTLIHDPAIRDALKRRVQSLRPDTERVWGRMTIDQMLWHVNSVLAESVGEFSPAAGRSFWLPPRMMRWLVLNVPWPKGAGTRADLVARARHDFEDERTRCLTLIDRVCARHMAAGWPPTPNFGAMSGTDWSRLQAKHLDHHLRQFGV